MQLHRIHESNINYACEQLAAVEPVFARLLKQHGAPPLWNRQGGFATMVLIILEQQVSLDSARAIYKRLSALMGGIHARSIAEVSEQHLRQAGLTRQKAHYIHSLAKQVATGDFRFQELPRLSDDEVRRRLCALKGIGPWTSDVYLLFVLGRPDIWPPGDIALIKSIAEQFKCSESPTNKSCMEKSHDWKPWRSVAARMLWHAYLKQRGRLHSI